MFDKEIKFEYIVAKAGVAVNIFEAERTSFKCPVSVGDKLHLFGKEFPTVVEIVHHVEATVLYVR